MFWNNYTPTISNDTSRSVGKTPSIASVLLLLLASFSLAAIMVFSCCSRSTKNSPLSYFVASRTRACSTPHHQVRSLYSFIKPSKKQPKLGSAGQWLHQKPAKKPSKKPSKNDVLQICCFHLPAKSQRFASDLSALLQVGASPPAAVNVSSICFWFAQKAKANKKGSLGMSCSDKLAHFDVQW